MMSGYNYPDNLYYDANRAKQTPTGAYRAPSEPTKAQFRQALSNLTIAVAGLKAAMQEWAMEELAADSQERGEYNASPPKWSPDWATQQELRAIREKISGHPMAAEVLRYEESHWPEGKD